MSAVDLWSLVPVGNLALQCRLRLVDLDGVVGQFVGGADQMARAEAPAGHHRLERAQLKALRVCGGS